MLKNSRSSLWIIFIGAPILLWAIYFWSYFVSTPLLKERSFEFTVQPGSSIIRIAYQLHQEGILRHPLLFVALADWAGATKHLKSGEYRIEPGLTPWQLLRKMVKGKVILRELTVIEGWTFEQMRNAANNNIHLLHTLDKISPSELMVKIGYSGQIPEGSFYPDTYLFASGISDVVVFKKAFQLMQSHLAREWQQRDSSVPYKTPYEAVIVASLIEKETSKPEERAKIAGVILQRLQKGMYLQVDATVIYGLGTAYTGKLTKEQIKIDTPYNTYLHKGLPPTAIAMPSLLSMRAALHPEKGKSLYYVATGEGGHEFTDNLQDHIKAVRKYRVQNEHRLGGVYDLIRISPKQIPRIDLSSVKTQTKSTSVNKKNHSQLKKTKAVKKGKSVTAKKNNKYASARVKIKHGKKKG